MSLPILHSYAGYGLCRLTQKDHGRDTVTLVICMLLANLADCDFLPGMLVGRAAIFHRLASHSLAAAVVMGLAAAVVLSVLRHRHLLAGFLLGFCAYGSHLVLDLFGRAPKGLMLFWPFSNQLVYGPFMDYSIDLSLNPLEKAGGPASFFMAFFHHQVLTSVFLELSIVFLFWSVTAVFCPVAAAQRRRESLVFARCAIAAFFLAASILVA